jgi:hypothetical protein
MMNWCSKRVFCMRDGCTVDGALAAASATGALPDLSSIVEEAHAAEYTFIARRAKLIKVAAPKKMSMISTVE